MRVKMDTYNLYDDASIFSLFFKGKKEESSLPSPKRIFLPFFSLFFKKEGL